MAADDADQWSPGKWQQWQQNEFQIWKDTGFVAISYEGHAGRHDYCCACGAVATWGHMQNAKRPSGKRRDWFGYSLHNKCEYAIAAITEETSRADLRAMIN